MQPSARCAWCALLCLACTEVQLLHACVCMRLNQVETQRKHQFQKFYSFALACARAQVSRGGSVVKRHHAGKLSNFFFKTILAQDHFCSKVTCLVFSKHDKLSSPDDYSWPWDLPVTGDTSPLLKF